MASDELLTDATEADVPEAALPASDPVAAPPRKRRTWWIVGIVVAVMALLSCCFASFIALAASSSPDEPFSGSRDAVAVIYIDQQISGVSAAGLGSAGSVTPEGIIGQLKKAENDESVKAIILRIDSPGGTASASAEIAMEVARVKKPIIASVGDVCASGAYMIASQCDEIMGTNSSDIGSIGVIMQVGDYSELAKKLGVKFISIHEGEFKDAGSPWRSLTATETAMLEADVKLVYHDFISVVAKGRKMSEADVRKLATGWAWPGSRAKQLGLMDTVGNYSDAVARAGKLGKIEGEPRIISYRDESLGTLLSQLTSAVDRLGAIGATAPNLLPARPTMR
ncbi:MAG: signal peptide peptidase SppA [Coriobacteriia bacterium]|nr:signal peptide peptidase SppA [Coriobacteriia bacterium]